LKLDKKVIKGLIVAFQLGLDKNKSSFRA
jgi:hypothetical protein